MSGKTSAQSINKYMKSHYKRITILTKPSEADEIKDYAKKLGISTNSFIKYCIHTTIRRINSGVDPMSQYKNQAEAEADQLQEEESLYI